MTFANMRHNGIGRSPSGARSVTARRRVDGDEASLRPRSCDRWKDAVDNQPAADTFAPPFPWILLSRGKLLSVLCIAQWPVLNHQDMAMRPLHPNDVAKQTDLMKRVRDAIANSITIASSAAQSTSGLELSGFHTSPNIWRPMAGDDFSFAR